MMKNQKGHCSVTTFIVLGMVAVAGLLSIQTAWAISCVTSSAQLFIVREECIEIPRGDCVFEFVL